MIRLRNALPVCLILSGTPALADAQLFGLIDERLEWMRDVAAFKYANDKPVEDVERENVVLSKTVEQAQGAGIDPISARKFFEAQIEAAKEIQTCWIARWTDGEEEAPTEYRDLADEVRPALISLGGEIIQQISQHTPVPETSGPEFDAQVQVDCLSDATRGELFVQLQNIPPRK
ncbi:gamma subclass chorismate mutase AroQ [Roseibium sp. RKSG952]|uniref:gamma subclass chorismate mutase AroQ n=1 Tax=Roseibium sp. RKSG952 TaxID=2529384 RepID=UPI0012BD63AA|nr:gamma subclass chorismate mutase AroQ [Roseibium sp. RKSG952]